MGDLMDGGTDRLHLAHALPDGDGLSAIVAKTVRFRLQRRKDNRHGRRSPQGLYENLIVLHIAGQRAGQLGKRLSLGLGYVKDLHRVEQGDFDFFLLHNNITLMV